MIVLDKYDIVSMLRGITPEYDQISELLKMGLGTYTGGFADRWDWADLRSKVWDRFTEKALLDLYLDLKRT